MFVTPNSAQAGWALSNAYAQNGNTLTNSSGGGRGGYSLSNAINNPLTTAPGNKAWSADNRREVGGLGGRPLTNINSENRLYFGGGGGSGIATQSTTESGSSGGGIGYLIL